MPRARKQDSPKRPYVRRDSTGVVQALKLVGTVGLPVELVAALMGLSAGALTKHVQRARERGDLPALDDAARLQVASLLQAHVRPTAATTLWFGASLEESMASFKTLKQQLRATTSTLDVYVYCWTSAPLADIAIALAARSPNPVAVRVMICKTQENANGSQVARLREAGIPVILVPGRIPSKGLAHHKFAIIDNRLLLDGSFNWSTAAARDNREHIVMNPEPRLVSNFVRVFCPTFSKYLALAIEAEKDADAMRSVFDSDELPRFGS